METPRKDPIDWNFKTFLQSRYSTIPRNDLEKRLDSILELAKLAREKNRSAKSILEKAANTIFRLFEFGEVAIGLKDQRDGLYRYEVLFGYTKPTEMNFKKLAYTDEDMVSYDKFPFVKTGRISELDPAEGLEVETEEERSLFDRPSAVDKKRASPEEFMEGDYIDVWMYDSHDNLIGWLELSRPKSGKMPPVETIRWIEVIAEVCAMILERKWAEGGKSAA